MLGHPPIKPSCDIIEKNTRHRFLLHPFLATFWMAQSMIVGTTDMESHRGKADNRGKSDCAAQLGNATVALYHDTLFTLRAHHSVGQQQPYRAPTHAPLAQIVKPCPQCTFPLANTQPKAKRSRRPMEAVPSKEAPRSVIHT